MNIINKPPVCQIVITSIFFLITTTLALPPSFYEHTIDGTFNGATSVYAIDLDGDGDVDVLGQLI